MSLRTITRVLLGLSFILAGGVKTMRFGKQFAPDGYKDMTTLYRKSYKVLPVKDMLGMSGQVYQEVNGYIDIICGIFLIAGQLVQISCFLLILQMAKFAFVLHKLEYPMQFLAVPVCLILVLMSICSSSERKEKQD